MGQVNRPNRKASDTDIVKLNSLGLSLSTIAETLDCHPTTITLRLKGMGIDPADTRRSFMEDIVFSMGERELEWLSSKLGPSVSIKDYIRNLIMEKYLSEQGHPAPVAAMVASTKSKRKAAH